MNIPRGEWSSFLDTFNRRHHRCEKVVSLETPLESVELDLEDQKNPRINVTVQLDNKVIKHILFLPSRLISQPSDEDGKESLQVEAVNTQTIIHLRPPVSLSP